ncbi:hypothetical protein ACSVIJ_03650 [Pseudomonas sp. NCHU5208]|uniref:hypothetical protein n=1 Tax=unclassified Pseudomonas TaxID=196821 RepID=UPI003F97E9EE
MEKDLLHLIIRRDLKQVSDEEWASSAGLVITKSGLSKVEFCDAYSRLVASEFLIGELSYAEGDLAMNRLSTLFREPLSGFSLKIYLAFDAGEYHRSKDTASTAPWLVYTLPLVIEALKSSEVLSSSDILPGNGG